MNRRVSIVLLSSLLISIAVSEARAQQFLVFVAAVDEAPPPATPQQLAAAIETAQKQMFAIASDARKDHGDRQLTWPPEAVDAVQVAENAYKLAVARRDYQPANTRLALDRANSLDETVMAWPAASSQGTRSPGPSARRTCRL